MPRAQKESSFSPERHLLNPVLKFKSITEIIISLESRKLFITITINNTLHFMYFFMVYGILIYLEVSRVVMGF